MTMTYPGMHKELDLRDAQALRIGRLAIRRGQVSVPPMLADDEWLVRSIGLGIMTGECATARATDSVRIALAYRRNIVRNRARARRWTARLAETRTIRTYNIGG